MQLCAESRGCHAAGITDAARAVETKANTVHIYKRATVALGIGPATRHQPFDIAVMNNAPLRARFGNEHSRHQAATRNRHLHFPQTHPGHLFGLADGRTNRLLGLIEIDDNANLEATRALMANPKERGG
jgi:hypothetical protein